MVSACESRFMTPPGSVGRTIGLARSPGSIGRSGRTLEGFQTFPRPPSGIPPGGRGRLGSGGKTNPTVAPPRLRALALVVLAALLGFLPTLVLAAYLGRGSFGHALVSGLVLLSAVPAFLLGTLVGIASLLRRRKGRGKLLSWAAAGLFAGAILFGAVGLSILPGAWFNSRDVREARFYCNSLIPRLEAHRRKTGAFPADIGDVGEKPGDRPRLLAGTTWFYYSSGDDYVFEFRDPSGMFEGHVYDSSEGSWRSWD